MELSKELRHDIYVEVLRRYKEDIKDRLISSGLCYYISKVKDDILNYEEWEFDPYFAIELYPEILKHKPESAVTYWFPINTKEGIDKRIEILEQAIEETI